MVRCPLALLAVFALGLPCASAQSSGSANSIVPSAKVKQENVFGFRLLPLPEALSAHLPGLPPGVGVLVAQVLPDSPAQLAGLKRFDIVLSCDGKQVKDGAQLLQLVRSSRASRKAPLRVIRAGKEMTLLANLVVLQKLSEQANYRRLRGSAKLGRPPALNMTATPLGKDELCVTFEYYPEGNGKLKRNTYRGSLATIEAEVRKLPMPVQDLARVALDRLRNRKKQP
jgi:membrane-associated protease RseP (regulator of RpoE activity)